MVFHGYSPTDALEEKVRFVDDQVNAFRLFSVDGRRMWIG
jgi:hypothetical protein